MKRIGFVAMLCVGLAIHALAQYDTRVFQVDAGGRVPSSGTANQPNELITFIFTVSGFQPGHRIVDVNINIDMVHSWVEDLTLWLIDPSDTVVQLFDGRVLPGAPPQFDNFDNTYFTDEAVDAIGDGSAPYNGDYRPLQALSAFKDKNPNGFWRLIVYDHYYGDYGYLYRNGDSRFEENTSGAPRWRGPLSEPVRFSEWGNPFEGGTWLEITVPEPASLMALAPALGWLLLRRRH